MRLIRRRSESSFYESFSDLIFCALVLFVALVMVLAANVGVQVDTLQDAQSDVDSSRQQLESIVNTSRYTGASMQPQISLAIDVRAAEPKVYLLPRECFERFMTDIINETPEQAIERKRSATLLAAQYIALQPGYSLDQFKHVIGAFSYRNTGPSLSPYIGLEVNEDADGLEIIQALRYSSLWPIAESSRLTAIEQKSIHSFQDYHEIMDGLPPDQRSVVVQISGPNGVSEHEAKVFRSIYAGTTVYTHVWFYAVASGWKLSEEGVDLEPPAKGDLDLLAEQAKPFEQIREEGNQVVHGLSRFEHGIEHLDEPVTILQIRIPDDDSERRMWLGELSIGLDEAIQLLLSVGGGNVTIQFLDEKGQPLQRIPTWLEEQLLNPTGFVNRTPDLTGLKKWLEEYSASPDPALPQGEVTET